MIPKISKLVFTQEADDCSPKGNQRIQIKVRDAGAGDYYFLSTTGWAFDNIQELIDLLHQAKELMDIETKAHDDLPESKIHPVLEGEIDPFGNTLPDSVPFPSTLPDDITLSNGTSGLSIGNPITPPLNLHVKISGDSDWGRLSVSDTIREPSDIELKDVDTINQEVESAASFEEASMKVASKSLLHGAKVMIEFNGSKGEGVLSINKNDMYQFVCSNLSSLNGFNCEDKLGYKYSWVIRDLEFDENGMYEYGSLKLQLID